jgi:hypothetical protein
MSVRIHIVVPGLFLPEGLAAEAGSGLRLPALEKILARSRTEKLPDGTLEAWLCTAFGVADSAIAPVTLRADGAEPGAHYWLRADPVHLDIRHDQTVEQAAVPVDAEEAAQLCASLNRHLAAEDLHFVAPHPQRWYLRLEREPGITVRRYPEAGGGDIRDFLPEGVEALRWDRLLNEIQMLLFNHPVNQSRERRGEWLINSLRLWGGGYAAEMMRQPCGRMFADDALATAFALAAGVDHAPLPDDAAPYLSGREGDILIVWDGLRHALQHGDPGGWRDSLQHLEINCLGPLLQALSSGMLDSITLDVLQQGGSSRFTLTRRGARKFWRLNKQLHKYAASRDSYS